jgi:hypothetical protein
MRVLLASMVLVLAAAISDDVHADPSHVEHEAWNATGGEGDVTVVVVEPSLDLWSVQEELYQVERIVFHALTELAWMERCLMAITLSASVLALVTIVCAVRRSRATVEADAAPEGKTLV